MTDTEYARIELRADIAANWNTANPVLAAGEPGYESDTGTLRIGDGVTPWTALPALSGGAAGGGSPPGVRAYASGYATTASFSATIPATAQVGDLLVLFYGGDNGLTGTPAGWSKASDTAAQSYHNGGVFVRRCLAGDPGATVTITTSAAGNSNWHIVAVQNATRIVDFSSTQLSTATATLATGDLIRKGGLLLAHASVRGVSATLTPTGQAGETFTTLGSRTDAGNSSRAWSAPATGPGRVSVTSSAAPSPAGIAANAIAVV